jgi:hypothetical protein
MQKRNEKRNDDLTDDVKYQYLKRLSGFQIRLLRAKIEHAGVSVTLQTCNQKYQVRTPVGVPANTEIRRSVCHFFPDSPSIFTLHFEVT